MKFSEENLKENETFCGWEDEDGRKILLPQKFQNADVHFTNVSTAWNRLLWVDNDFVHACFISTLPEYQCSVFKSDNPAIKISCCIFYTREDGELFKKQALFTSKKGSKKVIRLDDE